MVATGSTSRKYGLRSGTGKFKSVVVNDTIDVKGSMTFGDASTDTLVVKGASTFSATMDVNTIIDVDTSTTASNAIVDITQTGTGVALRVDANTTASSGIALEVDDEGTSNTNAVQIASLRTGNVVSIAQQSTTGGAVGLYINQDSTALTAYALSIDAETTGAVVSIAAAATTVPVFLFDASSFQAIDCTTTSTERLVITCGTNTRYIRLYSG